MFGILILQKQGVNSIMTSLEWMFCIFFGRIIS